MKINFEDVCLLLLTVQGFFIMFWEWQVYHIHNERFKERAKWREQKRRQQERKTISPSEVSTGPVPFNGKDVADNVGLSEGFVRGMQKVDEKT